MTFKPNVHTSEAIDPAGLKLFHGLVRDLVQKHLEQQKLVVRSHCFDGFRRSSSCVHFVVDAFDGVVDVQGKFLGNLHILPSAYRPNKLQVFARNARTTEELSLSLRSTPRSNPVNPSSWICPTSSSANARHCCGFQTPLSKRSSPARAESQIAAPAQLAAAFPSMARVMWTSSSGRTIA